MTQNNLGTALQEQGSRTEGAAGAELLAQAVAAYRAALEVRTRQDHPVQWAMTQNNLGAALRNQGSRTEGAAGADLLAQAVAAYRAALEVRTRQDHPVQWAMTQENLALAELARAEHGATAHPRPHLEAALGHVSAALEVYDPEHMSARYVAATRLRDDLLARLGDGGAGQGPGRCGCARKGRARDVRDTQDHPPAVDGRGAGRRRGECHRGREGRAHGAAAGWARDATDRRLGFAGLVLLWLTGIAMVAMAGGVAAMGAWFWVKMLAALMLTAAAVALQVATFTLPPERRAARVKPLGMVMLAGSVLSLVFAVLAFG
ncbi:MAG: hypothetical protein ACE368_23785 [Paracoccaceae bacterium]